MTDLLLATQKSKLSINTESLKKTFENDNGEITCGIYKIRDNTPEWVMSHDNSLWYEIYFENETAVKVRLQEGWYGG